MNPTLKGKVALVAGATREAGRGIAVELGAAGATVYITGQKKMSYGVITSAMWQVKPSTSTRFSFFCCLTL